MNFNCRKNVPMELVTYYEYFAVYTLLT